MMQRTPIVLGAMCYLLPIMQMRYENIRLFFIPPSEAMRTVNIWFYLCLG